MGECKRFVIQDAAKATGVCLDVYSVTYQDTGAVQLGVGYVHRTSESITAEVVQMLQATSANGSTIMPITASVADIDACVAELKASAQALTDDDTARLQQARGIAP